MSDTNPADASIPPSDRNDTENGAAETTPKRRGPLRWLYDWVLSWADTPYGTLALAVISFAESSFFPIPPDVLQMALSVSKPKRSFYYAAVSAVASVAGAVLGYYIGYHLWASSEDWLVGLIPGLTTELVDKVEASYNDNAFLAISGAAFTPIPYKVFTIAAGAARVPIATLLIASLIGRSARFFLVATFVYFCGPSVKDLIDRYFGLATLILFVLLIGGFYVVKVLLH